MIVLYECSSWQNDLSASLGLIRYVRREKEIAETKRELAESESSRYHQLSEHLQRQLDEARAELKEITEAAKLQSETATQHAEVLEKVGMEDGEREGTRGRGEGKGRKGGMYVQQVLCAESHNL